ncbi:MAG: PHP domain-containing protein [Actinomycetota bacterium]
MIDLHTHTTCSDGTDSPRELVNKALAQGIEVLGVTDHDSTAGWAEAQEYLRAGLSLVLGAEVSCLTDDGISVHILGLLFDGENSDLLEMLEESRDNRIPRAKKMIALMNEAGIEISIDDVTAELPQGATLGRPHIADALVRKGIVASRDEAFRDLLHNESKFYVSHAAPTPEVAIKQIRSAGGVAVIAHPFASLRGQILNSSNFQSLADVGLNGIEVDHRDQNSSERQTLRDIAQELNLVVTGSSDYHGAGKLNRLGEFTTDPEQWKLLESAADERRVVRK